MQSSRFFLLSRKIPERFAQEALGHNSKAVHRAYAKRAVMKLPSLEDYEQRVVAAASPMKGLKQEKSPDTTPGFFNTLFKLFVGVTTPNDKTIAGPGILACHQCWGRQKNGLVYLTNAQSLGDLAIG